jgi:5-methyltetrahydrofolate--homocysteine methyltransferase
MWDLMNVHEEIGVELTDSMAMLPAASVSGLYFAHPKTQYFAVGQVTKDQVTEYASRKSMPMDIAEKWLSPILAYQQ